MGQPKIIDKRLPLYFSDLHIHLGGAVAPHIMYSIAMNQGFKLPVDDYWDFIELITANPQNVKSLDDYLAIMELSEKIQSSPYAIEQAVYEVMSKEFRSSHVNLLELRFNPMKRNLGGERDLDHIIHAAIKGMEQAQMQYNIKSCLIFCLAREFSYEKNKVIVEKAIKYQQRGVLGIDMAGPESKNIELNDKTINKYAALFKKAKNAGLKLTFHTGETKDTGAQGVISVLENFKPDRIGHGIQAVYNKNALQKIKDSGVVLELCPTSNLCTRAVKNIKDLGKVISTLKKESIPFTINTDGPYLLNTNMCQETLLLLDEGILTEEEVKKCFNQSVKSSFINQ